MKLFKTILSIVICVGLGLIFLYSGYSKLLPVIETFEFTFVDIGIGNWYTAPIIARALIGLELFIGVLLIANYNLKNFTLKLAIGVLFFFIVYLILQLVFAGNSGNCGCFGEHFPMTPLEAIFKNIAMIGFALFPLFLFKGWKIKYNKLLLVIVGIICLSMPFVINPINFGYSSNNLEEKVNYPLELNLLYAPEDSAKVEIPKIDLRKGKHVVAFMSLTCAHCRIAGKKFRLIKKDNPALPIYFVLNGDKETLPAFLEDTNTESIPASFALGKTFIVLSGAALPRIYYLDNGVVVRKVDYFELNQYHIEEWVKSGKL
jgi:hypothetical protein